MAKDRAKELEAMYYEMQRRMDDRPQDFIAPFEKQRFELATVIPTLNGTEKREAKLMLQVVTKQLNKLKRQALKQGRS